MNRYPNRVLLLLLSLTIAVSAAADVGSDDQPLFSLTPYGGMTAWSDDIGLDDGAIFGGRAAVHLLRWLSVEGTMGWASSSLTADDSDVDVRHNGLDLVLDLMPRATINPYLLGGWTRIDGDSDSFERDKRLNGWEAAAGFKIRLGGKNVNRRDLRLEVRDAMSDLAHDFPNNGDMTHNLIYTAGLQFHFGRGSHDSDGDGVRDRDDICDETPVGATVDVNGCPTDSDGDGVLDGIDQCEGTPAGAVVDAHGCPSDADGDGVFDGLDRCDDTPAGADVDAYGCPSDADSDGIVDGVDQCADTPMGAVVDTRGCPVDSDGDGVYDGIDACPDTQPNLIVNEKGCPIEITETETQLLDTGMIRTSDIRFQSGSSTLDTHDTAKLDEIGETLSHWQELKVEIGGHTDSSGSAEGNQALSERRAQAVLDYLLVNFPAIEGEQYSVKGYGEVSPIADNGTVDGRAANRRVEFKVLNTEEIKRVIENRKLLER